MGNFVFEKSISISINYRIINDTHNMHRSKDTAKSNYVLCCIAFPYFSDPYLFEKDLFILRTVIKILKIVNHEITEKKNLTW